LRRRPSAGLLTARARRKTRKRAPIDSRGAAFGRRADAARRHCGQDFRPRDRSRGAQSDHVRDASAGISEACAVKFRSAS
jgi:hypothetical protein